MEEMELWKEVVKSGSLVLFMGMIIYFLNKKLDGKEKKVEELNQVIINSNRENLMLLNEVNKSLDKFIEAQRNFGDKVIENQNSKTESVQERLESLKNLIEIKMDFILDKLQ